MIAMILWGQVTNRKGKVIKFFFPLILLYILLLPFYVIALVVYFTCILISNEENDVFLYLKLFLNLPTIFNSMRNLEILVKNKENNIQLTIK